MLAPRAARGWGRVTALAAEHQISRTLLYAWRDCGQAATGGVGDPGAGTAAGSHDGNGRRRLHPAGDCHPGDAARHRAGYSARAGLLFRRRPAGYISQTLTTLGAQAVRQNAALRVPLPVLAEADEISRAASPV